MTSIPQGDSNILRGISDTQVKPQERNWKYDTSIWDAASEKADKEENKTSITVLMEDFSELLNSLDTNGRSYVGRSDAKKYGFFEKLFNECDNVFKSDEARKTIGKNGSFHQNDIYEQAMRNTGGLEYSDENDDLAESALNFARADIEMVEKAYYLAYPEKASGYDGMLSEKEINSYMNEIIPGTVESSIRAMDIVEEEGYSRKISAEEYASYMIAVDGMSENGFSMENVDGMVSCEEAEMASNMDIDELQKAARQVYSNLFANRTAQEE